MEVCDRIWLKAREALVNVLRVTVVEAEQILAVKGFYRPSTNVISPKYL